MHLKTSLHCKLVALFIIPLISCQSNNVSRSPIESGTLVHTIARAENPDGTPSAITTTLRSNTPSNSAALTVIAQTPGSTPLSRSARNETGITPGESTAVQVKSFLGDPTYVGASQGRTYWQWTSPALPNLSSVSFDSQGLVVEVDIRAASKTTAQMIIAQYGPPDFVVFYPRPEEKSMSTPGTRAPFAPSSGDLVYASKGIEAHFYCDPSFDRSCPTVQLCTGVPRMIPITDKIYFVPLNVSEWIQRNLRPAGSYCVRPWSGFTD